MNENKVGRDQSVSPGFIEASTAECVTEDNSCDQDEYVSLKEELKSYIQEAEQSFNIKSELLRRNTEAVSGRPSAADIAKRDPSVKKNSTFIKKLRNVNGPQIDLLIKECRSLNLTKYLSEAAAAIVEARVKFTDIPAAVLLCTEINCAYADFCSFLQEEFIKVLSINKEEPIPNANRLRVELCFYAELSLCGVISARQSLPVLGTALTNLTADKTFNTLNLILSFCKHCGPDFAGLVPRRIRLLCDQFNETVRSSLLLTASKQDSVRNLLHEYYLSLCQHLHHVQDKLSAYENQNRQILIAKGEVRPDRVTNAEVMRTEIQTLLSGAVTLAELLDVELPDLPDSDLQDLVLEDGEDCSGGHVWEDEETRKFYTELPDVREFMNQLSKQEGDKEKNENVNSDVLKPDDKESSNKKHGLESFLKLLPDCRSKTAIDNAALEFLLYLNSKSSRKKLVITLFTLPRNKVDLIPFYARFVAILNPVLPEVTTTLCQQLKSEMMRHIHKKDQVNLESKKKTVKFVAELVNFGVYAKKEVLRFLKMLLYDFTHHNIEMVCCLLERCGAVLYAASDTHLSTKYYLEQMMRLKTMMALDARYVNLIESTYYQILPPMTVPATVTVKLSPMEQFIAKVIYQDLMKSGSEQDVLHTLQCLNWKDDYVAAYTVKCLTDASKMGYLRIRALASVVSMLADYQEDAVCRVVDGVLEDIRLGMELNEASMNQRRVAMVKYLGELYNYRLLDSSDILKVLYSLVTFGVSLDTNNVSPVDPPSSVVRVHIVLLLLDTCAFPTSNQEVIKKLTYFCTYFQRYYWVKRNSTEWTDEHPFPKDIIHRFEDVLNSLLPDFDLSKDYQEAISNADSLNSQMFSQVPIHNPDVSSFLGTVFEADEFSSEEEGSEDQVERIAEAEINPGQRTNNSSVDEDFLIELNKMISDGVKESEINKAKPNIDIAVPINYKKTISNEKVQFVVLMKKGNKQTCKTLNLPPDHELFVDLKYREEASRKEKEKVKRLTLDINERLQDD